MKAWNELPALAGAAVRRQWSAVTQAGRTMMHRSVELKVLRSKPFRRASIFLSLPLVVGSSLLWFRESERPVIKYIGYVGRYLTPLDSLNQTVLTDYIDEFNGRLSGVKFELKTFAIGDDWQVGDSIYRTVIAPDERYIVVIDNTWGKHLQPTAPTIRKDSIPVIATNADKHKADFGGHVLFLGHDDNVPQDIVGFAAKILGVDSVVFVAEEDYAMTKEYAALFDDYGIRHVDTLFVPTDTVTPRDRDRLFVGLRKLLAERGPGSDKVVLVNTHGRWGREIVAFVDSTSTQTTVVGAAFITSAPAAQKFGSNDSKNTLILSTNPIDAMVRRVSDDLDYYRATRPQYFAKVHYNRALYLRRCLDSISLIAEVLETTNVDQPERVTRDDFAQTFRGWLGKSVRGKYDLYEFDSSGKLRKEVVFEQHRNGISESYLLQLSRDGRVIPNIRFGLDILDISDVDINRHTFHAEFFFWHTLHEDHKDAQRYVQFANLSEVQYWDSLPAIERDGVRYQLHRVSAKFYADYKLQDYPLDKQELKISLEIINPADEVRISFDHAHFEQSKAERSKEFRIKGWDIKKYYATVDNVISSSLRGNPNHIGGRPLRFKALNVRLVAARKIWSPLVMIMFPLIMIGLAASALMYVKDKSFSAIGDVTVGTFLSIVTYSIAYGSITPDSSMLTKADILFYTTFGVVLVNFIAVILINSMDRLGRHDHRWIERLKYGASALYLAVVALIPLV